MNNRCDIRICSAVPKFQVWQADLGVSSAEPNWIRTSERREVCGHHLSSVLKEITGTWIVKVL